MPFKKDHGMTGTKEYRAWWNMISRCNYKCVDSYSRYGNKGISVCREWRNNFKKFYTDMGEAPTKKHTLDRIDNTLNYCKDNCRWVTPSQQAMNRRLYKKSKTKYKGVSYEKKKRLYRARITVNGKTISLGRHKKASNAAKAYDIAALKLFNQFALTNEKLGLL